MIRIIFSIAALTGSAAIAQACPAHDAHASVDTRMTVASIQPAQPAPMSTAQEPSQATTAIEEK